MRRMIDLTRMIIRIQLTTVQGLKLTRLTDQLACMQFWKDSEEPKGLKIPMARMRYRPKKRLAQHTRQHDETEEMVQEIDQSDHSVEEADEQVKVSEDHSQAMSESRPATTISQERK